jgi:hypothetical protein
LLLGGATPVIPTILTGMINPCNCWMPSMRARKRRGQAIGRVSVVTLGLAMDDAAEFLALRIEYVRDADLFKDDAGTGSL